MSTRPASNRGLRKAGRDLFQALLAVAAGGGTAAVVALITGHVSPTIAIAVTFAAKIFVTYAQNALETRGAIPVLLPSPGLVTTTAGGMVGKAVGTVDAVVEPVGVVVGDAVASTGQVVGAVLDTAGQVVGGVTGAVGGLLGKKAS